MFHAAGVKGSEGSTTEGTKDTEVGFEPSLLSVYSESSVVDPSSPQRRADQRDRGPRFRGGTSLERLDDGREIEAGVADYWRQTGKWGDGCQPVGTDDFQCQ